MARGHGPSAYREVLRRLKDGQDDPGRLVQAADAVPDAGYAARALAAVAADRRTDPGTRRRALERLVAQLGDERREVAVAEAVPDILKRLPVEPDSMDTRRHVVDRLVGLPDGRALSGGLRDAAKSANVAERERLFARAATNGAHARDDVKAVLRASLGGPRDLSDVPRWLKAVAGLRDPDLRARSAAYLHHEIAHIDAEHPAATQAFDIVSDALAVADPDDDRWRAVVRAATQPVAIDRLASVLDRAPDATLRADIHLALGAQADRLGDPERARRSFDKSAALLPLVPPKDAKRLGRKLEAAVGRLEGRPVAVTPRPTPAPQAIKVLSPTGPLDRHALALVNTYTGGTAPAHLRAVARAAPLCVAFGLDLVLVGFPDDAATLVTRSRTETRISGRDPLAELAEGGRLRTIGSDPEADADGWRAADVWVATSEKAEEQRKTRLEDAARGGSVALLVGLGPKGLPLGVRRRADAEYEITGQGIGLETATALGILADRLGRIAPPKRQPR